MKTNSFWVPFWGLSTLAMGFINLISALTPVEHERWLILRQNFPLEITSGSRMLAVVAGLILIMVASGIFRHKHHAWATTVLLLIISSIVHLTKGLDYEETLLSVVLLIGLISQRKQFRAVSDPVSVNKGISVFISAVGLSYLYGVLGFYLLDRHFHMSFSLLEASGMALRVFFTLASPPVPHTHLSSWFINSIYTISCSTVLYALWMLLRPVIVRHSTEREALSRASGILQRYGRSSLARFTIWDDKSLFFSSSGTVYCSYKVMSGIAVVLGDPIGPAEDIPGCVEQFDAFCHDNDWIPAYYQVLPDNIKTYNRMSYSILKIGEEAIVELDSWTMQGAERKNMRNLVNRLTKLGYSSELLSPPLSNDIIHELRTVSQEWLEAHAGAEKTFSLGYFKDDYIRDTPVMAVFDPFGSIVAFANIIPEYSINEATIDLMRQRNSAERGTMEFLFIQLIEHFKQTGYEAFNLGLAPLSGVGHEESASTIEKAMRLIYQHFNHFYSFRGLRLFKDKFDPRWEPRYLAYKGGGSLLKVAYSIVNANSGGKLQQYFIKKRGNRG